MRIVLDPSRFGKQLGEFALRDRPNQPFAVEYDRTGTARSLIQCQNVLFHMLVFLCCFLRPARRFYPLRLQIYQKIPGFETKPQSFFSKPSLALHTGVGLTAPARKLLAPQSGLRLSHATRCAFAHSTPGRSRRTDAAMDKKCPCIVARMDFLCYIWTTIRCKGGLLLCFT